MPNKLSQQKIAATQRRRKVRNSNQSGPETDSFRPPSSSSVLETRIRRFETRLRALRNSNALLSVRKKAEYEYSKAACDWLSPLEERLVKELPDFSEPITAENIDRIEAELGSWEEYLAQRRMMLRMWEEMEIGGMNDDLLGTVRKMIHSLEQYQIRAAESGLQAEPGMEVEEWIGLLRGGYAEMEEALKGSSN
ncbi:hypothetical protein BJ508DRAFT_333813 [Ascobolus immersus RN42]|uniref:Uncharacterized protein n=1 Tax=Ascobolus immersus RN42 TaxID=1160509 RepID=A0A3N4HIC5_ASCIM|nr:hypothetical protein BJ508DRAFT_333813 [Ascobolus immersus RN42]